MGSVVPSLAGPKRPAGQRVAARGRRGVQRRPVKIYTRTTSPRVAVEGKSHDIGDGDVVIAAITSCTNTSNPSVLVAAGLVARKANALGLKPKPWVKTEPRAGLAGRDRLSRQGRADRDLDAIGFNLVGYGCTTCIGNSGPLAEPISAAINGNDLVAASVCRATAISKAASRPTCAPISSPRRRWSSPMR